MSMHSDIDPGHQPRRYYTPAAPVRHMGILRKIARWVGARCRNPRGHNAVPPGLPPEIIGTGYRSAYYPNDKTP